jgi:hypothetical protein
MIPGGSEQQFGMVWVVNTNPDIGRNVDDQERINGNKSDAVDFNPRATLFARPASNHGDGALVAFCGGNTMFLRNDIDYIVYQQLITPEGRKSVDPRDHGNDGPEMTAFRNAPPLSEESYQ